LLGGKISNQDEEDVEEELAALQAEANRTNLPNVPLREPPPKVPVHDISVSPTPEDGKSQQPSGQPEREAVLA
jgi:charged multivesicular body protein 6